MAWSCSVILASSASAQLILGSHEWVTTPGLKPSGHSPPSAPRKEHLLLLILTSCHSEVETVRVMTPSHTGQEARLFVFIEKQSEQPPPTWKQCVTSPRSWPFATSPSMDAVTLASPSSYLCVRTIGWVCCSNPKSSGGLVLKTFSDYSRNSTEPSCTASSLTAPVTHAQDDKNLDQHLPLGS